MTNEKRKLMLVLVLFATLITLGIIIIMSKDTREDYDVSREESRLSIIIYEKKYDYLDKVIESNAQDVDEQYIIDTITNENIQPLVEITVAEMKNYDWDEQVITLKDLDFLNIGEKDLHLDLDILSISYDHRLVLIKFDDEVVGAGIYVQRMSPMVGSFFFIALQPGEDNTPQLKIRYDNIIEKPEYVLLDGNLKKSDELLEYFEEIGMAE